MASVSFDTILSLLKKILGDSLDRRNDPKYWWVNFKPENDEPEVVATVKSVSLSEKVGLKLVVDKDGTEVTLEAKPTSLKKSKVLVNGELDPDASLIFALKSSFGNPSRWAFDFKHVTLDGEDYRVDTRFDP